MAACMPAGWVGGCGERRGGGGEQGVLAVAGGVILEPGVVLRQGLCISLTV
jgi:hypothetical protein